MNARAGACNVTGGELSERTLGTLWAALLLSGAGPARSPFGRLGEDHQFRDLLPHHRILVRAGLLGALDDQVNPPRSLRIPGVWLIGLLGLGPLFGVDFPQPSSAISRRRQAVGAAALMRERGHGDLPSVVHPADDVFFGNPRVGEKDLVE